jgi:hypothetical protein
MHGLVISLFYIPRFAVRSLLRHGVAFEFGSIAKKAGVSIEKGANNPQILSTHLDSKQVRDISRRTTWRYSADILGLLERQPFL